jgi:hypothetical protein
MARTSGRQQGKTRRAGKANPTRRSFLKTALGWTADHAAGGVVQAAVLSGGAALLRRATSPRATVISAASTTPWEAILTPRTGSVVVVGEAVRLELHARGTLV